MGYIHRLYSNLQKAASKKDPLKTGESFTTLWNEEARRQEHDALKREQGFPEEQDPNAMRYQRYAEVETDEKGVVQHPKPPWVVNEASEMVAEINDEDAPTYKKSEKAANRAGKNTASITKSLSKSEGQNYGGAISPERYEPIEKGLKDMVGKLTGKPKQSESVHRLSPGQPERLELDRQWQSQLDKIGSKPKDKPDETGGKKPPKAAGQGTPPPIVDMEKGHSDYEAGTQGAPVTDINPATGKPFEYIQARGDKRDLRRTAAGEMKQKYNPTTKHGVGIPPPSEALEKASAEEIREAMGQKNRAAREAMGEPTRPPSGTIGAKQNPDGTWDTSRAASPRSPSMSELRARENTEAPPSGTIGAKQRPDGTWDTSRAASPAPDPSPWDQVRPRGTPMGKLIKSLIKLYKAEARVDPEGPMPKQQRGGGSAGGTGRSRRTQLTPAELRRKYSGWSPQGSAGTGLPDDEKMEKDDDAGRVPQDKMPKQHRGGGSAGGTGRSKRTQLTPEEIRRKYSGWSPQGSAGTGLPKMEKDFTPGAFGNRKKKGKQGKKKPGSTPGAGEFKEKITNPEALARAKDPTYAARSSEQPPSDTVGQMTRSPGNIKGEEKKEQKMVRSYIKTVLKATSQREDKTVSSEGLRAQEGQEMEERGMGDVTDESLQPYGNVDEQLRAEHTAEEMATWDNVEKGLSGGELRHRKREYNRLASGRKKSAGDMGMGWGAGPAKKKSKGGRNK